MTGPSGPEGPPEDDWGFPEVDPAGPSSTALPVPEEPAEQVIYDTGSDAWWRAQAEAQRQAAATEPPVPPAPPAAAAPPEPPATVEPEVLLSGPSPLDAEWVPPELPELRRPAEPDPVVEEADPVVEEAEPEPVVEEPATEEAAEAEAEPGSDWYRGLVEDPTPEVVAAPMPEQVPVVSDDSEPRVRAAYTDGPGVSRGRALAGALLALAGVGLGVGALLVLGRHDPDAGGSTVANPPATSSAPRPTSSSEPVSTAPATIPPTVTPTVTPTTTTAAAAPIVPVSVLNNSKTKGLAATAATRFRAGGWPVPQTGNYRGTLTETTLYYPADQQASAERFAKQFGIARVLPRTALPGIPVSGMTLILTRAYRP